MEQSTIKSLTSPEQAQRANECLKAGDYRSASGHLESIIDFEPANWNCRLLLAVCHFRTGQTQSAHRAFQYICDSAAGEDYKRRAYHGIACLRTHMEVQSGRAGAGIENPVAMLDEEMSQLMGLSPATGQVKARPKTWSWQKPISK